MGLRVSDLIGQEGIERKNLIQYTYPSDEELQHVGVTASFTETARDARPVVTVNARTTATVFFGDGED